MSDVQINNPVTIQDLADFGYKSFMFSCFSLESFLAMKKSGFLVFNLETQIKDFLEIVEKFKKLNNKSPDFSRLPYLYLLSTKNFDLEAFLLD